MTEQPQHPRERHSLDAACEGCFQTLHGLYESIHAIKDCDLDKHEQPWRVVENTHALAGALANLLHQLHSKRPGVNAPVADMLTEPRPPANNTTTTEPTK